VVRVPIQIRRRTFFRRKKIMLVLSRKMGEGLFIGNGIQVKVLAVRGNQVKLGFIAPADVPICRKEIQQAVPRTAVGLAHGR
jgi:carbon storage regulator